MSAPSRRLPGPDQAAPAVRLGRTITVGIIGAGRVGAVLGAALHRAGHRVVAASGVSASSVARIERLLPSATLLPADQVPVDVDLLLIAVPDDTLAGLVRGLVVLRVLIRCLRVRGVLVRCPLVRGLLV